ncbi:MAG: hypothetical protein MJZ68_05065 [archaeon]|nr:hypothetical protein [archaeon]
MKMVFIAIVLIVVGAVVLPSAIEKGYTDELVIREEVTVGDSIVYDYISYVAGVQIAVAITYEVMDIDEKGILEVRVKNGDNEAINHMTANEFRYTLVMPTFDRVFLGVEDLPTPLGHFRCNKYFTVETSVECTYYTDANHITIMMDGHETETGIDFVKTLRYTSLYEGLADRVLSSSL